MDEHTPVRITHNVSQCLRRRIESLADVERAFVHVNYQDEYDIYQEHRPPYEAIQR
jgi:hypothetical protein